MLENCIQYLIAIYLLLAIECADNTKHFLNREKPHWNNMHSAFIRLQLQRSRADKVEDKLKEEQEKQHISSKSTVKKADRNYGISKYSSDDEDASDSKWKLELAWLSKTLEPALQFCRWALPTGLLSVKSYCHNIFHLANLDS